MPKTKLKKGEKIIQLTNVEGVSLILTNRGRMFTVHFDWKTDRLDHLGATLHFDDKIDIWNEIKIK